MASRYQRESVIARKKAKVPTSGYFKGEVVVRDGKCRDIKTIKKEDEVTLHTQAKLLNGKSPRQNHSTISHPGKTTQR